MKQVNILILVALVLLSAVFVSCSKDGDEPGQLTFPVKTRATRIELSDVRLFTKSGEITNKQQVANYVSNNSAWEAFPTREEMIETYTNYIIIFNCADSAYIYHNDKKYEVTKNGELFLFSSINYPIFAPTGFDIETVLKHQTPKQGNYYKKQYVAYGNYNAFSIMGLNFRFIHNSGGTIQTQNTDNYIYNEFDASKISSLAVGDTLAIQQYKIIMNQYE